MTLEEILVQCLHFNVQNNHGKFFVFRKSCRTRVWYWLSHLFGIEYIIHVCVKQCRMGHYHHSACGVKSSQTLFNTKTVKYVNSSLLYQWIVQKVIKYYSNRMHSAHIPMKKLIYRWINWKKVNNFRIFPGKKNCFVEFSALWCAKEENAVKQRYLQTSKKCINWP